MSGMVRQLSRGPALGLRQSWASAVCPRALVSEVWLRREGASAGSQECFSHLPFLSPAYKLPRAQHCHGLPLDFL